MNRNAIVAAVAALAVGFGGGYFVSEAVGGGPSATEAGSSAPREFRWNLFGRPRDADAARPGPRRPEGFAVWRTRTDTSRPEPAQCVEMSRPLNRAASYDDFVLVSPTPERRPAVAVSGAELCVSGLGFAERRITLLRGLPAADGTTLAANADVDFATAARPPYVGFVGQGVILPRDQSDGVGIETLNVSRIHVEVWRVPDRNLVRRSIAATDPTAEGEYSYDGEGADDYGRSLWSGQIPVQANGRDRVTTVFPLGAVLRDMRPGAYWIKVRDASGGRAPPEEGEYEENPPAQASRWVVFTDMALTAYRGSEALDVVVRSLNSARAMGGVRVALVGADGDDLAVANSDGSGRVRFARALLQGTAGGAPRSLMAYGPGADFTTLDLTRSPVDLQAGRAAADAEPGRTVTGPLDAFVYADRGIYRPGEQVHLVALLRDSQARAVKDRRGAVVFRRPSGVEAFRFQFPGAPTGAITADATLPRSAPRGRWSATVEIEGVEEPVGSLSFNVEDFAPQRLAVTAAAQENRPVGPGEVRPIEVTARFLYGATGAGLQTQFAARVRTDPNPFPQLEGFRWGDEIAAFEEQFVEFDPTVTDGEGRAAASFDASPYASAAAPLVAAATASVFEPGGRPVTEGVNLKLRPRALYLGAKFDAGVAEEGGLGSEPPMSIQIAAVDAAGRRVAAQNVAYQLIRENWEYDWYQQDGQWRWRRTNRDVVVTRGVLNVGADGSARLDRRLGWGDYRLVLDEAASGAHTALRFTSGWSSPSQDVEAPDFVRVTSGQGREYALGDTVEITIAPPYAGEAQIAVATDRLIDFQTVSVGREGRTIRLRTDANWGGGAYILVSVIQPRDPAATPRPRRALGLLYVPLTPRGRTLSVNMGTAERLRGRDQLRIPVQVEGLRGGQRARVTVAAVDEGILRLTRFENPDPIAWYFGRRALTLDYMDDYGRLLDPNLGAPAQLNYGGDEIGGEGLTVTPIRTVALWSGVVETGMDGRAVVTMPAPDFNGELRLMAVAWTDESVGGGTKSVVVREPVVAELNLPRFLAPGDRASATIELHNVEARAGAYTVAVTAVRNIVAGFRQVFDLLVGQRLTAQADIAAPTVAGIGRVAFAVTGPGFSQTREYPIQTRLGWGAVTRTYIELQQPGTTFAVPAEVMRGLAAGTASVEVSYSPIRGFDPGPVAAALSRYPYGCSEQIVSMAYPLLYAPRVAPTANGGRAPARASTAVTEAVSRLLDRQSSDGAFGLWSAGDYAADAWLGAYLTDFLVEARAQGAYVPPEAYDRALSAMTALSRPDGTTSVSYVTNIGQGPGVDAAQATARTARLRGRASAYALYVLAKAGRGDLARLRWWHDVRLRDEPSPMARAHVAAGLALLGDRARSRSAFRSAVAALGYREPTDWYQSPLRDLAAVTSLAYEVGERQLAGELSRRLENSVGRPDTLNTQEQAFLLQAAQRMLTAAGSVRIDAGGANRLPGAGLRWFVPNTAGARFANAGSGALWRTVTVRGVPIDVPPAESTGVSLSKTLFRLDGSSVDPTDLVQGERVVVRLSGSTDQARTVPLILDDALPAGWEIETVLGPEDGARTNGSGAFGFVGSISTPRVQEQRDDRYVASVEVPQATSFTVAYIARAVTRGDFLLPGAEARDLYRPTLLGRTAANRLIVRSPTPVAPPPVPAPMIPAG